MPISKNEPMASREEIFKSLENQAAALWGAERIDEHRPAIEGAAGNIWQLSQDLPDFEVEPGFYL